MRRYVNVARTANGATVVTVSLVDGDLSSKCAVKTYTGQVDKATVDADKGARKNLQQVRDGLDALHPLESVS